MEYFGSKFIPKWKHTYNDIHILISMLMEKDLMNYVINHCELYDADIAKDLENTVNSDIAKF